ncbi:MAG: acyl-CoA dehydrogenase family protein [Dehalococcoidia bacterium]
MDWADTPEQAAFREEVRKFIDEGLPQYYKGVAANGGDLGGEGGWQTDRFLGSPEAKAAALEWEKKVSDRGWVAPHWPKEYGGAGMSSMEQFILKQEMAETGAPEVGGQGVAMLGPTVIAHGTEEQKKRFLPATLACEMVWCQGYSEPGAGSDLASLQTRGVRDGDEWVVNGQKIWTSNAHRANWIWMLVRTDPDAPKHRGITFMLSSMDTPGIGVRPLISGGGMHFSNETFYEDVRIPQSQVIGEVNRGWYVGMTLLDYERSNISGAVESRRELERMLEHTASGGPEAEKRRPDFDSVRLEVADRYIETEVGFNFSFRIISMQNRGLIPNYEASTSKMFASELNQRIQRTGTKVFGLNSQVWDPEDPRAAYGARFTQNYFHTIPSTIAGGTSEIQRNIIATRGLGLPRG